MTDIRVGIIGTGRIGSVHAHNLMGQVRGAELVAVADVMVEAARSLAAEVGVERVYDDPSELLSQQDLDAVLICSSTDTHAALIEAAAEAGKAIFCEKPIALELGAIDRALEAVERAGVTLQVGFNRRFDPSFAALRDAVDTGRIGTPEMLRITSRDPEPPPIAYVRGSGGIFCDMMIHDLDMARFVLGEEVVEVYAMGSVLVDPAIGEAGDVDTATVTLRFASGALGVIENSRRAAYGYDQRAEVFGSKGMVASRNHAAHTAEISDATGVHGPLPHYFFLERYNQAYVNELQAFCDCVRDGSPPPVSGADGRTPVVMALAAGLSLRANRPVRLEEVRPEYWAGRTQ